MKKSHDYRIIRCTRLHNRRLRQKEAAPSANTPAAAPQAERRKKSH